MGRKGTQAALINENNIAPAYRMGSVVDGTGAAALHNDEDFCLITAIGWQWQSTGGQETEIR